MLNRFRLNDADIHAASDQIALLMEQSGIKKKLCQSTCLATSEILGLFRRRFGEGAPFLLRSRRFGRSFWFELECGEEPFDPLKASDAGRLRSLLREVDAKPVYRREKGKNTVRIDWRLMSSTLKSIRFSWPYLRSSRPLLLLAAVSQLFSGLLAAAAPIISASIIRAYVANDGWRVPFIALSLLIIQLLRNFFSVCGHQIYNRIYTRTLSALEEDLVFHTLQLENSCIDENGSGLFIQRLTTDTERIAFGFNILADSVTQAVNQLGILIAMFVVSPPICLVVIVLISVQTLIELWRTRRLTSDDRRFRNAKEGYSSLVGEMIRGQKDIKALSAGDAFLDELNGRISLSNEKRLVMQRHSWNLKLLRLEVEALGSYGMILLLAALIATDAMIPANALILFNYYSSLGPNFVKLIGSLMDFLSDFNLSNERVSALLNEKEFPKEKFGPISLSPLKGEISFEHVFFGYKGEDPGEESPMILKDMSFRVKAGERLALVGKSGCGKTTVFNLIDKLYEAQEGIVRLDGQDIKSLSRETIREGITVVNQNPYIFHMSVRDNLLLAKRDASDEELSAVCRSACIEEDILRLPKGYDSLLGEGGVNLSGGQRQRLAIARALLRDSRIILFDEATSALDNLTQEKIQTAIDNLRKGRTVILIAHRLSTVLGSDRILYMQDGTILASGSHENLLATCEPYRLLASMEGAGAKDLSHE